MINVKSSEDALSTPFSKELMIQCQKYGFEGHSPWTSYEGKYYNFHVSPIDESFNISILNRNTYTMKTPEYFIDIGNNEIFNNKEFIDYINALQNAQNLVNYLNNLDWSKCPNMIPRDYNEESTNISNMESDIITLDINK